MARRKGEKEDEPLIQDADEPPVAGGPRLPGKKAKPPTAAPEVKESGGIRWLPIIFLFLMVGPVMLPAVLWAMDRIAISDIGVKVGLSNPRQKLVEFFTRYDQPKLKEVDSYMRKYKGKYKDMYKKLDNLKLKYERLERLRAEDARYRDEDD